MGYRRSIVVAAVLMLPLGCVAQTSSSSGRVVGLAGRGEPSRQLFGGISLLPLRSAQPAPPAFPSTPGTSALPARNASSQTQASYVPITGKQRLHWFVMSSVGPQSLTAGVFSAAIGTGLDRPREYGPHWEGFGERYGIRLTGVVTGNAMEAGLGAIWGEDPRYFRATGQPLGKRIKHLVIMTFLARNRAGDLQPAYARYMATAGNNFLSNTWREPSESTVGAALERTALGFAGRMGSDAFQEFWPDVRQHVFHRSR